ncbi:MAG: peptidoglycan DD-metalloendopeptidase family protein [Firmicutes bacterium]|nr:peptidoglycan DD-metalloendopeptidase family protein [Bacillota bacterium]
MSLDNYEIKDEKRSVKDDISKQIDEKIARLASEESSFEERFAQMQREKELQREQLREKRDREEASPERKRARWRKRFEMTEEAAKEPVKEEVKEAEPAEEATVWDEIQEAIQEMDREAVIAEPKESAEPKAPRQTIIIEEDHEMMAELDSIAKEMEAEQEALQKQGEQGKKALAAAAAGVGNAVGNVKERIEKQKAHEASITLHSDDAPITIFTKTPGLTFEKKSAILRERLLRHGGRKVRRHKRKIQVKERRFAHHVAGKVERFDRMINVLMKRTLLRPLKHLWNRFMDILDWMEDRKVILAEILALVLFCTAAITTFMGHITAYEYAYNGRALGIVKTKEEVYKTIDAIGDKLSSTHHARVEINKDEDITFREVHGLKLKLDTKDEVLNNLTYMQDLKVMASGIYKDGELIAVVQSADVARDILDKIKDNFTQQKENESRVFDSIGFAENVEIREISVNLGDIENEGDVLKYMLTGAVEKKIHTVQSGETFSGIAKKYGLKQSELQAMNPGINPSKLKIAQQIILNRDCPVLTLQTTEVVTYIENLQFDTIYEESSSMYEGETSTRRKGVYGTQEVVARVKRNNGEEVSRDVLSTKKLTDPVSQIVVKGTKKAPPRQGTGTWAWPIKNYRISSKYGSRWNRMHNGVDLAAPTGTKIYATDGGTVTYAGYKGTFGYLVIINHGGNYESYYAHCSKLLVKKGDKVFQGQNIALVGNTGRSTGPHLHFEIRYLGTPKNPFNYI